jgi:hypothetical protein
MSFRHCLAALAVALLGLAATAVACGGTSSGNDGGTDGPVHDAMKPCVDAGPGAPTLIALSVTATHASGSSPAVALVPAFSPDIHDYYVRCPAATNALTVTMEASSCNDSLLTQPVTTPPGTGKQTKALSVKANQAVVAVAKAGATSVEYWVRCLPPDFPPIQMVAHPAAGKPTPGYYLVGTFDPTTVGGYAMVLDGNGVPVWYHLEPKLGVFPVESLVEGGISYTTNVGPFDPEPFELIDVATLKKTIIAPTGIPLDPHELRILPDGSYVAISDRLQTGVNLSGLPPVSVGSGSVTAGPNANMLACDIIEFSPNGMVTWTWRATDHLDPAKVSLNPEPVDNTGDSGVPDGAVIFNPLHCNSVDVDPKNGNLLVSSRDSSTFFYVERSTGNILWRMGGSDAGTLDPGAAYIPAPPPGFDGQHDVRLQPGWSTCSGGQVSLYDDETYSGNAARAVVYDVKLGGGSACDGGVPEGGTPSATQTWQYAGAPEGRPSTASGSFRISSDGSRVIGWGLLYSTAGTVFTEVDDAGHPLLDFESALMPPPLPPPMGSYRAIKVPLTAFDLETMRMTAGH